MTLRNMTIDDYDEVFALWEVSTSANALNECDNKESIAQFLEYNKNLSLVAVENNIIVGSMLVGNDGRHGSIYHISVLPEFRRCGIAKKMLDCATQKLSTFGIKKIQIFCFANNTGGQAFWLNSGFKKNEDTFIFLRDI